MEDAAIALFGASFFIGVWYALPMVNTVTDVWAFGGGVLRAMEAHSFLPGYGVAYGTLSFYQNFIAMAITLVASLPFFDFDIAALKTAFILNPSYTLLVPRIVSALTAVVFLGIVYRFLKNEVESAPWRFTLLVLAFGNVLAAILVRSGKMWILSIALGVVSFLYVYRAITEEVPTRKPGVLSAVSIFSAFLAAANFAFAGLFLINIPILMYAFPKTREIFIRLAVIIAGGATLFVAIFALNAANVLEQVSVFAMQFLGSSEGAMPSIATLSVFEAFMINVRQAIEAFPLLLIALVIAMFGGVRNKTLAVLAALYIILYIVAVSVVFRVDDGIALNVRHVFPIGFFLLFLLAALRPPMRVVSHALTAVGLLVYIYTVALLSMPTTYNVALGYAIDRYGAADIRIDESVFELTLPMNKKSYMLHSTSSCGSACTHARTLPDDITFRPIVVTHDADPRRVATLPPPDLFIASSAVDECTPLARFGNDIPDDAIFDIDINLGRMLMPEFYKLRMLGKNLYLYNARECTPPPFSVRQ
ncbi:MAG: hypothetical protein Q8L01_02650 [Candidatus Woesebacteria bacterium]|nr:hypothetical protein [Candidatus Woesebacteria bacterium]